MKTYRVLVVDDSAFMRKGIAYCIEEHPLFEVVGYARNGREAIEKTKEYSPDVITMDIEMPIMDGLESVKHIMAEHPTPILVLSDKTIEGNAVSIEALQNGAIDVCYKEGLMENDNKRMELQNKLKMVVNTMVTKRPHLAKKTMTSAEPHDVSLLIIGSSTGGPSAVNDIITKLTPDFPVPILVVQHMANGFTGPLAEKYDSVCALKVVEAERDMMLEKGHVYIAPAGYQTTIRREGRQYRLQISKDYSEDQLYKPSVDVTVLSATPLFTNKLMVAILTGMGEDGLKGCRMVKQEGGYVLAESEETAIVYGMPKMVIEAGLADEQVPIHHMYERIRKVIR